MAPVNEKHEFSFKDSSLNLPFWSESDLDVDFLSTLFSLFPKEDDEVDEEDVEKNFCVQNFLLFEAAFRATGGWLATPPIPFALPCPLFRGTLEVAKVADLIWLLADDFLPLAPGPSLGSALNLGTWALRP